MSAACIIIPYFGSWPRYFNLFLNGCKFNPALTVLIFTDQQPPLEYPENVRFHPCTLERIRTSLDAIVGFKTSLTTPYKLCDVRPAYGLIFENYLSKFDFWGWGDIDLIYGKLDHFNIDELLKWNDVISFRSRWVSGSFCLIRNTELLKKLFLSSTDLNRIYGTPEFMGFDEISFQWEKARTTSMDKIKFPWDNFTRMVRDGEHHRQLVSSFQDCIKESIPGRTYLIWNEGVLTDNQGKEYLLYHYISEKKKDYFKFPKWDSIPGKFLIDSTGFYNEYEFGFRRLISAKRVIMSIPKGVLKRIKRIMNRLVDKNKGGHNALK